MVVIGYCAAQSVANDAQRIVGTWTNQNGTIWVFNENGTGTRTRGGNDFNYGISAGGKIIINKSTFDLFMSPDGKRMSFDGDWYQKQ